MSDEAIRLKNTRNTRIGLPKVGEAPFLSSSFRYNHPILEVVSNFERTYRVDKSPRIFLFSKEYSNQEVVY
jgi:hypothetical protein